jgi:hypothetical protein
MKATPARTGGGAASFLPFLGQGPDKNDTALALILWLIIDSANFKINKGDTGTL